MQVPADTYYGAQAQRAANNFPISTLRLPPAFIQALAMIKKAAAAVNAELGLLAQDKAEAIVQAADEIVGGQRYEQFVVDVFQTGSGTSTNMNMNEVLACRANEIMTGRKEDRTPIHPNDHVNQGQSSNDVIPTTIHLAAGIQLRRILDPALAMLQEELGRQAGVLAAVRKIGRTHLQDAVPITLGDEFGGYARQIELARERIQAVAPRLQELALGGTAVGSGLNTHPQFAGRVIARLAAETEIPWREAANHYQAQAAQDTAVELSGALKALAAALVKIANDLRWLASGPRCGLGEINLPALQPGSSIMPGKVNPVIPEMLIQVAAQVVGNDATITLAGTGGNFELNVMLPVIAFNLLQSIELLGNACRTATEKCIRDISANPDKCAAYIEQSLALVTGFVPHIGYDRAAELAYEAYRSGRTVREVAQASNLLDEETLRSVLD
jgi:fumarate hydratase class II